ncbi:MAG: hypothetical protein ACREUE_17575 [Panacagrimonas sp.]
MVRFSVEPQAEAQLMRWLDGGHVAEVPRQLEAYEANTALKAKFAQERAPFEKHMRIERFAGETEKSYGH